MPALSESFRNRLLDALLMVGFVGLVVTMSIASGGLLP
jgi:hypothetical protein